jgi:tRNA(Arg) A34 adenosine deaminase TadA
MAMSLSFVKQMREPRAPASFDTVSVSSGAVIVDVQAVSVMATAEKSRSAARRDLSFMWKSLHVLRF